jgi:hypothetical protein
MKGLESWSGVVYCTSETRRMVRRYAAAADRVYLEERLIGPDHPNLNKYADVKFVRPISGHSV